ncbi:hypothetical protein DEO72_LG4g1861 [Vigna unguiculata]|uniref:Uncharacterized protein n=1 Tax=Vigna unguiculata TaxID=3917 RepID=A0A4D6LQW5_VIGUN|nr:hypothetical protein DEO72_LG4g1861 [Vigna unguiculata]
MAEALLEIVIENLGSFIQDQLATYWGIDQQLQKLSSNLTAIRAVLRDAERKQITSYAVKDWLQKLTDAAYVLDDILDECSIHSTKMHSVDGHTSRLSRLHPKDILFRFHIGKRMRDITESRSFFQEAEYDKFGMITTFKMHDLFHDLAQSIMGEECVVITEKKLTPSSRVHYLSRMGLMLSNHCYLRALRTEFTMLSSLKSLAHLRYLSLSGFGGYGLAELHSLQLGGTLRIKGLENVANEWDAKQANLMSKKELNHLHLSWSSSTNPKDSNVSVERVLEVLEPPSTLKSFHINDYQGRNLSSWMRSPITLRDLVEVKLFNCENCEELPPLGKLAHLKRLEVSGMKNVKCIDGETYEGIEEMAFPSLEELILKNLPKLEKLLRDEGVELLPRLSQLTIHSISKLKFPRLPFVEELYVERIDEVAFFMEGVVGNTRCLKTLNITLIKGAKTLPDQLGMLDALEDFNEVLVVADMDCMRDAMNKLSIDSNKINPLGTHFFFSLLIWLAPQ